MYIDKLDDIVNEYNAYHRTIKMKPVDVKDNIYTDVISYIYTEVFIIKKVKNTGSWTYVIKDLNGEEILGTFYERELQKTAQQEKG